MILKVYIQNSLKLSEAFNNSPISAYRRGKLERASLPNIKEQNIRAEQLLCYALSLNGIETSYPLNISCNRFGKPFLADKRICFNISHSNAWTVCALSDVELGVDIQADGIANLQIARRFFSADEYEWLLHSKEPESDFFKLWTMKESYIKALGTGMNTPLSSFTVLGDIRPSIFYLHGKGYHLSVCTAPNQIVQPEIFTV